MHAASAVGIASEKGSGAGRKRGAKTKWKTVPSA
jgi:hypothetical protein